jgi:hypothetical protein
MAQLGGFLMNLVDVALDEVRDDFKRDSDPESAPQVLKLQHP